MQARAEVDSKRNKLSKVRGVPGIKEEKIAEAERDLNEAAHKVENAQQDYELIVRRMSEDLARFQVFNLFLPVCGRRSLAMLMQGSLVHSNGLS